MSKTEPRTIDLTPTWKGVLPVLLLAYTNGGERGRAIALEELQRMADIADEAVAEAKAVEAVAAAEAKWAATKAEGKEPAPPPTPAR